MTNNNKKINTLLIDADIILFQMACSSEKEVTWGDIITLFSNFEELKANIRSRIRTIKESIGGSQVILCISSDTNFRKGVYPEYKGNRLMFSSGNPFKPVRKPLGLKNAREWLSETYPCFSLDSLEADDCLGILGTSSRSLEIETTLGTIEISGKRIIVSEDKDLEQIPGYLWTPRHQGKEPKFTTLAEGNRKFFTQVITGDPTDNYPGLPGSGEVKARKILEGKDLEDEVECWTAIVEAYTDSGLTEEDALVQARVARILRSGDYCKQSGVRLWTPKSKRN